MKRNRSHKNKRLLRHDSKSSTSSRMSRASSRRKVMLRKQAEQKRFDELKKYQITPLQTNLELFLNEYCVREAWQDKNPKNFLINYLNRSFTL